MAHLAFKGDRTYLHGTSIFEWVVWELMQQGIELFDFDFRIRRPARNLLELVEGTRQDFPDATATLTTSHGSQLKNYCIVQSSRPVEEQRPYDESVIRRHMSWTSRNPASVKVPKVFGLSDIELWVSANKFMLQQEMVKTSGQWVFTSLRGQFYRESKRGSIHTLTVATGIDARLTRSHIGVDENYVGSLDFSWAWER